MMAKKRKRPLKEDTESRFRTRKQPKTSHSVDGQDESSRKGLYNHPVLCRYYPQVFTLRHYLLDKLSVSSKARRRRVTLLGRRKNDAETTLDSQPKWQGPSCEQDPSATTRLAELLDSTLVGVSKESNPATKQARQKNFATFAQSLDRSISTGTRPACSQSEVVDFVISTLFARNRLSYKKPQHILAHGLQKVTAHVSGPLASNIPELAPRYLNENVSALKSPPWTDVLSLLGQNGEEIMIRLLLDCGIFSCLDRQRSIYYQISGIPLAELESLDKARPLPQVGKSKLLTTTSAAGFPTSKSNASHSAKNTSHKPNSIVFVRRRMLYARPALNAKGGVRFGLRHIHVLNRFPPSTTPDSAHTVHVMKYIFPRQFGLHNVFTSAVDTRETVQPFKDYTLRENEIVGVDGQKRKWLRGSRAGQNRELQEDLKIPKRLRGRAAKLAWQLQKRNQSCPYNELLRHYCSIEEVGLSRCAIQCSQALPKSPISDQLATRPNLLHEFPNRNLPHDSSHLEPSNELNEPSTITAEIPKPKDKGVAKQRPCLTDYATPTSSVSAFCRSTLQRLVPKEFWGIGEDGAANRRIIWKHVDRFIRMSRFESLSLHEVCRGLKVTCIPWLEPPAYSVGHRLSLSDFRKRTELLHELVYYLFDSLLIPLIRTNFYVTESQIYRNRLFYFRHDVWRTLTEQPLVDIKSSIFQEIRRDKARRILTRRSLGYSTLRLLPKTTGARPIVNLRRRMMKTFPNTTYSRKKAVLGASINSLVTPIFNMLNYEKMQQPELLGSAMFSVSDIYPRLKAFKAKFLERRDTNRKEARLYFVKLDIQSCFDTIPQDELMKLIEDIVTKEAYHITKHVEIRPPDRYRSVCHGQPIRKFVSKAVAADKVVNLPDLFTSGATSRRSNTVFVDTATQNNYNTDDLLDLLEEHIRHNLVKIGKKYFRQRNGIPQGSVLSSLLCNFFYGKLEQEVLRFLNRDDAILLRLIDDFLLITSESKLALHFLQIMMDGQPKYGISVNPNKSLVNFEAIVNEIHIPRLVGSSLFPYCGNLIDTHTLELRKDRDRRGDPPRFHISDTLTVESNRVPGESFHRKTLASFQLQTRAMFLDTSHNTQRVVLFSIYTNFVETAIKMYRYLKVLRGRAWPSPKLVMRTIHDLINLSVNIAQSVLSNTTAHFSNPSVVPRPQKSDARFEHSIKRIQVQYLAASAFRHVLQRKQTQFTPVLQWLRSVEKETKPRTDSGAILMRGIIRAGNGVFDEWRF